MMVGSMQLHIYILFIFLIIELLAKIYGQVIKKFGILIKVIFSVVPKAF